LDAWFQGVETIGLCPALKSPPPLLLHPGYPPTNGADPLLSSPGFCLPCVRSQRGPPLSVIGTEANLLPPGSALNHNQSAPADRDGLRGHPRPPYLFREDPGVAYKGLLSHTDNGGGSGEE